MSRDNHWHFVPDFGKNPKSYVNCGRPEVVGIMENDGELSVPKHLLYFRGVNTLKIPLDLNKGFEDYRFRDESHNRYLNKIEWYLINQKEFASYGERSSPVCKVYTERRVLIHILSAPYTKNDWIIYATMFKGDLYLCGKYQKICREKTPNDSYHFKFRQYCFSESPEKPPNTDEPIDERKQIYCIYRRKVGEFDLYYSAETSGIQRHVEIKDLGNMYTLNECNFVLTKLVKDNNKKWQTDLKTLTWWIQGDFSNAADIYVGFKDKHGYVRQPVQHIKTECLIHKKQYWKPLVCLDWLQKFLSCVEREMRGVNCPYTVYEIMHTTSNQSLQYRIHEGKNEHSFLSERFIESIKKK